MQKNSFNKKKIYEQYITKTYVNLWQSNTGLASALLFQNNINFYLTTLKLCG